MTLHGLLADAHAPGDLLVRQPVHDEPEHLALTGGELDRRRAGRVRSASRAAAARGVERRLTARGGLDRGVDLVGLGVLQQVADRAGIERLHDALAVGERREHDDAGLG